MSRFVGWVFALCYWVSGAFAAAEGNEPLSARLGPPAIAPGSVKVEGVTYTHGHLKWFLKKGLVWEVRMGEEPVGLYFEGEGSLQYQDQLVSEFPALKTNLKRMGLPAAFEVGSERYVNLPMTEGLLWSVGLPIPDWGPKSSAGLPSSFEKHRSVFERVVGREWGHLFEIQRINGAKRSVILLEALSPGGPISYLHDGTVDSLELLSTFKGGVEPVKDNLYPITLSEQPVGWSHRSPISGAVMLSKVVLDVDEDRDAHVRVVATETFVPMEAGLRAFELDLYNERWGSTATGSPKAFPYRVVSIKTKDGLPLTFHHNRDRLLVVLPKPATPSQSFDLRFEMEGPILYAPQNDSYWTLGAEPWFPLPELKGQYYQVEAVIHSRPGYVPIASGTTVSRTEENGRPLLKVVLDKPVAFFFCAAGKFKLTEVSRGEQLIRVATYVGESIHPEGYAKLALGAMEFYKPFLGSFPFPEYNIIIVNGSWGWSHGQAPPGLMFMTLGAFKDPSRYFLASITRGINGLMAHEVAHQYWGHVVKCPTEEEVWLNEAFAEYVSGLYLRAAKGESEFRGIIKDWEVRGRDASPFAPIPYANRLMIPGNPDTYQNRFDLIYGKGPYLLSRLHEQVGEKAFLTFLKAYQLNFQWKFGSTEHVGGLLGAITKQDLRPFFEKSYWGTAMP